jgi:hypothetical protein
MGDLRMRRILVIAGMCALAAIPAEAQQGATVPELAMLACKRRLPDSVEAMQLGCQTGMIMTLRTLCPVEKVTGQGVGTFASEEMREFVRCMFASATAVLDRSEAEYKAHSNR